MTEAPAGPPGSDEPPTPPERLSDEVRQRNFWTGTVLAAVILTFIAITCYTRSTSDQAQPGGRGMYPSPNKPSPTGVDERPWKNRDDQQPGETVEQPGTTPDTSSQP
jgi:hypothetical protein